MITQIEKTILTAYLSLEYFNRATTAHISPDFFESESGQILAKEAIEYTTKHQSLPTKTILATQIEEKFGLKEIQYRELVNTLDELYQPANVEDIKLSDSKWMLDTAESWCRERSVFNAILKSMSILDGKAVENKKVLDKSIIPELMQKALSISFDSSIGHDYLADADARYAFMHSPVAKIPFASDTLNKITGGGIEKKSLSILVCPPHAGKSLTMASWASDWLRMGYNVLVITLEMAEMKIGERIDANMLNVDIGDLKKVPEKTYKDKFKQFNESGYGVLKIKEYPMSTAGASHFRFLLQELDVKQDFRPDIVVVDYMGICISSRFKSDNMYQLQKAVGEELRSLAQEKDLALVTAVQTNKQGYGGADFDMGDISESSGHAMTADFILGLISTDELIAMGQVRVKQLKNRWGSIHDIPTFLLNMDRKKMKVYEESIFPQTYHKKQNTVVAPREEDKPVSTVGDDDAPFVFNKSMIIPKKQFGSDFIT